MTARAALSAAALAASAALVPAAAPAAGGHSSSPLSATNVRYASDEYPGFDDESLISAPERKSPRWFRFFTGPAEENPAAQMRHCEELLREGSVRGARRQLDALVREWPTSPEAPVAQRRLAETCLANGYTEDAFEEYRYLLDFYSLDCDYAATADLLYKVANLMRAEGKEICFVKFANTVDVRRAYEACVLRAPGAAWAPEAMMSIGRLREDEGKYEDAVKVYENLRSIHPKSPEAKASYLREAESRAILLSDHGYNRSRCRDTIAFLKLAQSGCREGDSARIAEILADAERLLEDEDWKAAAFYDSPTRTARSAANAYEKFLSEHPRGARAAEAKARIDAIRGGAK